MAGANPHESTMPALDEFDHRLWEVDLTLRRVTHVSGFSARVCSMPMSEAELRALNADGLVAIGTMRGDGGARWAVLATSAAIEAGEGWAARQRSTAFNEKGVSILGRHAALAWMRSQLPPPTIEEAAPLRPLHSSFR